MATLVVFDLDGTLVDSERDLAESANELLALHGASPLPVETITRMVGDGARKLVERALAAAELDAQDPRALDQFLEIYDRRLLIHTRPYPGLVETVRGAASRTTLALLTNKPERQTRRLIDAIGCGGAFTHVIGGDSGFPRKPDPAALSFLVAAAGATSTTTLVVGDSMVDVETARRAGAAMCVALYGFGHHREPWRLTGDEFLAHGPEDVGPIIARFLDSRAKVVPTS